MPGGTNHKMVRVPAELVDRLKRVAADLYEDSEKGEIEIEVTHQGDRGVWVPLHAVITRALDELEANRQRRRKRKTTRKKGSKQ